MRNALSPPQSRFLSHLGLSKSSQQRWGKTQTERGGGIIIVLALTHAAEIFVLVGVLTYVGDAVRVAIVLALYWDNSMETAILSAWVRSSTSSSR